MGIRLRQVTTLKRVTREQHENSALMIPRAALPMAAFGAAAVVAGGILAAATAHAPSQPAVWATAYLVLVVGVVQVALAIGLGLLAARPVTGAMQAWAFGLFNLGNAAVLTGTLLGDGAGVGVWIVDVGGVLLAASMVLLLIYVRGAHRSRLLAIYVAVVAVILVSMPIGLVLARS